MSTGDAASPPKKDIYERVAIISAVVVSIFSLIVTASNSMATYMLSKSANDENVKVEYVKMAIDVLKAPPDDAHKALREYATKIVDAYSTVKLPDEAKAELTNGPLVAKVMQAPKIAIDYQWPSIFTNNQILITASNGNDENVFLTDFELSGPKEKSGCGNFLDGRLGLAPKVENNIVIMLEPSKLLKCIGYDTGIPGNYKLIAVDTNANYQPASPPENTLVTVRSLPFVIHVKVEGAAGTKQDSLIVGFAHFQGESSLGHG